MGSERLVRPRPQPHSVPRLVARPPVLSTDPRRLGVAEIQHLQRTVGNTAVCTLIRASATRGGPAATVQRAPEPPAAKPGFAERLRAGITKVVDLITDFLPGVSNAKDFT